MSKGGISNKIRMSSMLKKYITEKISENQSIKRYLFYNTQNPLSTKGKGYDDTIKSQPNIEKSLINKNIFDIPFNPDMIFDKRNTLYIGVRNGSFTDKTHRLTVLVDIVVEEEYYKTSDGYRDIEIAQEIANMFDCVQADDKEYIEEIGNVELKLSRTTNLRLTKSTNHIWYSMEFEVILTPIKRIF